MKKIKNIALIGGSFNPPTISHMIWGSEIYNLKLVDKIIYIPCGERDDKKLDANPQQRFEMLNLFIKNYFKNIKEIEISDIEIKNKKLIPTYDLINKFENFYKNSKLFFVIGSDLINSLKTWDDGIKLYNEKNFILFNRIDYPIFNLPPKTNLLKIVTETNISSTLIRNRIKLNKFDENLGIYGIVDKKVIEFIKKNKIYF